MKQLSTLFATALLAALPALAQDQPKAATPPPAQAPAQGTTAQGQKPVALEDRASYIIGLNLGQSLKSQDVPVTPDHRLRHRELAQPGQ